MDLNTHINLSTKIRSYYSVASINVCWGLDIMIHNLQWLEFIKEIKK